MKDIHFRIFGKEILAIIGKDNNQIPGVAVMGRNIITVYDHFIVKLSADQLKDTVISNNLIAEHITENNLSDCEGQSFPVSLMKNYLQEQPERVFGYIFYDAETRKFVGYYWTALRGADEIQYRIRHIDAYNFNLCVAPEFRGRGYAQMIIAWLFKYVLAPRGIDIAYSAIRTNNVASLRAHEKFGAEIVGRKRFVRILRVNIPYCTI